MDSFLAWSRENALLVVSLVCGALALAMLMPRANKSRAMQILGSLAGIAALAAAGVALLQPTGERVFDMVFYLFSGIALLAASLTITNQNPVYAALWFAVATVSVCGLFLLKAAPFLAAATVIVYAGAIVVTFLFVVMLAQQQGLAVYDRQASRPFWAILIAMILLGGIWGSIFNWKQAGIKGLPTDSGQYLSSVEATDGYSLSRTQNMRTARGQREAALLSKESGPYTSGSEVRPATMRGLGRTLFGDYLFAVELAGTVLMVAAIGAIAVAPRRSRGTL